MIKIGIVGTGDTVSIGHCHALAIESDKRARLTAVFNRSIERSESFIAKHNAAATAAKTYEELLDKVDAVVICTPNDSHYYYAKAAIEAGKSVLLEKPVANRLEEAKALADMNLKDGQVGFVGFIYRYSNLFNALKDRVKNDLGEVFTFSVNYGGKRLCNETLPIEWRMLEKQGGSGAICDYVSHVIDLADYTSGIRLEKLKAFENIFIKERSVGTDGKTAVENADCATICGMGKKGELFSVMTSRLGMEEMRVCVTGRGGMLVASDREPTKLLFFKRPYGGGMASEPIITDVLPQEKQIGRFYPQMSDFISAVEGSFSGYADFKQGLYVEEVIDKINRSCKE